MMSLFSFRVTHYDPVLAERVVQTKNKQPDGVGRFSMELRDPFHSEH